ncbi:MAG: hypothetical protein NC127_06470 [Muribaculum sp.]|nr:hypothetical protein [Muribaculum sp.]
MKKSILLFFAVVATVCLVSCGGSSKASGSEAEEVAGISVDEVMANPESFVGDTIVLEGVVSHLCRQGGRKAFVAGNGDNAIIRCEAYPLMGEPFAKETVHKPIKVKGIFREQRIDEDAILEMEKQNAVRLQNIAIESGDESAERAASAESGCETERAAQGQADLTTFAERMADYRAKIADREAKEGKAYLSYYYVDALSYDTLEE